MVSPLWDWKRAAHRVRVNGAYEVVQSVGVAFHVAHSVTCRYVRGHAQDAEGLEEVELFGHGLHTAGESNGKLPCFRVRNLDAVLKAVPDDFVLEP